MCSFAQRLFLRYEETHEIIEVCTNTKVEMLLLLLLL